MWRLFLRLRLFTLLFETAGLPPLAMLARAALTLALWHVLSVLEPLGEAAAFGLVVLFWFVIGHAMHWRTTLGRLQRNGKRATSRDFAVVFCVTAGLAVFAPGPAWFQHLVTFFTAMHAVACLIDMIDGQETFGRFWWPGARLDKARGTLTRAFFLKHSAFALLNETVIAIASPEAWLVWLAVLPILGHFVSTALTTTILLDAEESG